MKDLLTGLQSAVSRIAPFSKEHPIEITVAVAGVLMLVFVGILLSTPLVRQGLRKFYYLARNAVTADRGPRDIAYLLLITVLLALPLAVGGGYRSGKAFDWEAFFSVFVIVGIVNGVKQLVEMLSESGRLFRPVHGAKWRSERKISTAAILGKATSLMLRADAVSPNEVRDLLRDLLGVMASHVRDHRGNHRQAAVFANLLIVDGDDLVVVARDPLLHGQALHRPTPVRHRATSLAVSRCLDSRSPVVVGDYRLEYPESVKTKPYSSILGLPVIASDGSRVVGVVSIDSTRPYFFENFHPGEVGNHLENSLAPYIKTLGLVMERLLSPDPRTMIDMIARGGAGHGSPEVP